MGERMNFERSKAGSESGKDGKNRTKILTQIVENTEFFPDPNILHSTKFTGLES
jgi:hypothetical protein